MKSSILSERGYYGGCFIFVKAPRIGHCQGRSLNLPEVIWNIFKLDVDFIWFILWLFHTAKPWPISRWSPQLETPIDKGFSSSHTEKKQMVMINLPRIAVETSIPVSALKVWSSSYTFLRFGSIWLSNVELDMLRTTPCESLHLNCGLRL